MNETIIQALRQWHAEHDARQKLQHLYIVIIFSTLVLAGLISLVNYQIGQNILLIASVGALVYMVNLITWAMFDSLTRNFFYPKPKPSAKSKTKNNK